MVDSSKVQKRSAIFYIRIMGLVNPENPDIYIYIWVNYNDLTATSLGIMVSKGNHPQMALIQVSDFL